MDPTGKMPGRGAYLHDLRSCWEKGLKGALAHALKTELTQEERETLSAFSETLPQKEPKLEANHEHSLPEPQTGILTGEGPNPEGQKDW